MTIFALRSFAVAGALLCAGATAATTARAAVWDDEELDLQLGAPVEEGAGIWGCELRLGGETTLEQWESDLWVGAPAPVIELAAHTEKDGAFVVYDQIPRRADRPEDYDAYKYPVATPLVVSGYDLDRLDEEQRRGKMNAVGHGGVDLAEKKGAAVTMIALEHQIGDSEVIYTGWLFGETVVTRHTLREGGRLRDYVLIFGHLDEAADGVRRGRKLREGDLVGYVGDTGSPELVHLHLEARRLRDGVDAWTLSAGNIYSRETTIVTDPRNVLRPRVATPVALRRCAPRLFAPRRRVWLDAPPLSLSLFP